MATFKRKNENGNLIYSRWWLGATLEKIEKVDFQPQIYNWTIMIIDTKM